MLMYSFNSCVDNIIELYLCDTYDPDTYTQSLRDIWPNYTLPALGTLLPDCIGDEKRNLFAVGDLLKKKNADYGNSVFTVAPLFSKELREAYTDRQLIEISLLTRMSDKISRINNLHHHPNPQVVTESLDDAITDLFGYLIIHMVFTRYYAE